MKKDMRVMIGLMIAVIIIGGLFLLGQGKSAKEILHELDPESFDVETVCIGKEGQSLICNEGNDTFFCYDDVQVFLKKMDTEVKENGDEVTKVTYKESSVEKLEKMLEQDGSALLYLWLTDQGRIETIMLVESSFTNHNATLANLEGLDPSSYTSSNVMLTVNKKGMTLAPVNYTAEERDKFTDYIREYPFADKAGFYLGTVTLTTSDDGTQNKNTQYAKISYREVSKLGESTTVHIWLDEAGCITNVLVHQEIVKEATE